MKKYPLLFIIAIGVIALDQITKAIARALWSSPVNLLPFLQLRFTTNTGAAFSLFHQYPDLLMWLVIVIIGLFLYYMDKLVEEIDPKYLGLILGGAIGNLIDRVFIGRVSDFIDLSFWPTFNIADSCIFIGVGLIIFSQLCRKRNEKKEKK